ncbi:hypothetical protein DBV15_10298 [Temnothorax longispinosus]|uniref:Uncharacterized protein n=1 Tax=Temnothorax longispinosus TaxID=300112 RepID=A0A4S2J9S9_9HYME|nr:hypothetical protein DBV15_10298 [Temnothorax longispinosus]
MTISVLLSYVLFSRHCSGIYDKDVLIKSPPTEQNKIRHDASNDVQPEKIGLSNPMSLDQQDFCLTSQIASGINGGSHASRLRGIVYDFEVNLRTFTDYVAVDAVLPPSPFSPFRERDEMRKKDLNWDTKVRFMPANAVILAMSNVALDVIEPFDEAQKDLRISSLKDGKKKREREKREREAGSLKREVLSELVLVLAGLNVMSVRSRSPK